MNEKALENTERLKLSIGEVVIEFQFLEYELSQELCSALKLKNEGDIKRINAAMGFRQKVNLYCEVYIAHEKEDPFNLDIPTVRKALGAAEEFRNAIVHSFWHVSGNSKIVWMRSKSNIASNKGMTSSDGLADIRKLEKGIKCMQKIRYWYLGDKEGLITATKSIRTCTRELSRKVPKR